MVMVAYFVSFDLLRKNIFIYVYILSYFYSYLGIVDNLYLNGPGGDFSFTLSDNAIDHYFLSQSITTYFTEFYNKR